MRRKADLLRDTAEEHLPRAERVDFQRRQRGRRKRAVRKIADESGILTIDDRAADVTACNDVVEMTPASRAALWLLLFSGRLPRFATTLPANLLTFIM
ncbi:hypothetical protein [Caballeronia calidae]|uniref:hypothetical protein n=1 Tax=Caballeronia calidae TaxID=1777139 RepID=UPI001E33BD23|nr:hypothetical protein [Caballeronia calidae]